MMNCCGRNEVTLQMHRGDTEVIPLAFIKDNQIVDYGSNSAVFTLTVKENIHRNRPIISKAGVKSSDNEYIFTIEHEDTKDLDFGDYVFDIEMKDGTVVKTIVFGKFKILGEVTL